VSSASRAAPAGGLKTRDRSRRRGGCKRLPRHDSAAARSTLAAMRSATRQRLPTLWGRRGNRRNRRIGKDLGPRVRRAIDALLPRALTRCERALGWALRRLCRRAQPPFAEMANSALCCSQGARELSPSIPGRLRAKPGPRAMIQASSSPAMKLACAWRSKALMTGGSFLTPPAPDAAAAVRKSLARPSLFRVNRGNRAAHNASTSCIFA
jgi:hypothetical protein